MFLNSKHEAIASLALTALIDLPEEKPTAEDVTLLLDKARRDYRHFGKYVLYGNNSQYGQVGILKGSTSSGNAIVSGFGLSRINGTGDSYIVAEILTRLAVVEYCGKPWQKVEAAYYAYRLSGLLDKALGDTHTRYRGGTNLAAYADNIAKIKEATPGVLELFKSPLVSLMDRIKTGKDSGNDSQEVQGQGNAVETSTKPTGNKLYTTRLRERRNYAYESKRAEVGELGGWRNPANAREPLFALSEEQGWGRYGAVASALVIGELGEVTLGNGQKEPSPYDLSISSALIEQGLAYIFGDVVSADGKSYKFDVSYVAPRQGPERLKIDFYSVSDSGNSAPVQEPVAGIRIKPERDDRRDIVAATVVPVVPRQDKTHFTEIDTGLDNSRFELGQGDALIEFATKSLVARIIEALPRSVDEAQRQHLKSVRAERSGAFTIFVPKV